MTRATWTLLLLAASAAVVAAQQSQCERPACLPGSRWNGRTCHFELARPGSTDYTPTCGADATLETTRGVCVVAKCKAAPVSGGKPATPTSRTQPISGGPPATMTPRAAPISGGPPGAAMPDSRSHVDLRLRELDARFAPVCGDAIHASPQFYLEVYNPSEIATSVPVTIRAVDSLRPEVRGDTTIAPLGPRGRAVVHWKLMVPAFLRYGTSSRDVVRGFIITVDPDQHIADPDLSNNSVRTQKILIICRHDP